MTVGMQFQLVVFVGAVIVCVAWTKLVYYDGLHRHLARLRRHCIMHAGMIASVSVWAMSMGFNLHHTAVEIIEQKNETIQQLATGLQKQGVSDVGLGQQIAFVAHQQAATEASDYEPARTIEIRTPSGTVVSFRNEAEDSRTDSTGSRSRGSVWRQIENSRGPDDTTGRDSWAIGDRDIGLRKLSGERGGSF